MGSEEGLQAKRSLEEHVIRLGGELKDTLWNVEVGACQSEAESTRTRHVQTRCRLGAMVNDQLVRSTAPPTCVLVLPLLVRSLTK